MATWPHISAKNKTDVLQEDFPLAQKVGRALPRGVHEARVAERAAQPWQNVMCKRWDTPRKTVGRCSARMSTPKCSLWLGQTPETTPLYRYSCRRVSGCRNWQAS